MASYDPKVLQQHAEQLYAKATNVVFSTGLKWGFAGFVGASIVSHTQTLDRQFLVAGIALFLGFLSGWSKAFELRLEAQRALCVLQTEINTRPKASEDVRANNELPVRSP